MKRCIECGCLMDDTHESDVCEVCAEEMGGLSSDRVRTETTDEEVVFNDSNNRRGLNRPKKT